MKPYAVKATLKTTLKSKRERWGIIDFADGRKPGLEKSIVSYVVKGGLYKALDTWALFKKE